MNRPIILFLLLSACAGFLGSCAKDDVTPTPIQKYEFEGEWLWVETDFGWSPPINPDSLGFSLTLRIDHTTYTLLANASISSQLLYEFDTSVNSFGDTIEFIRLETGKRYNLRVDSINLELSDDFFDGSSWHYVRK